MLQFLELTRKDTINKYPSYPKAVKYTLNPELHELRRSFLLSEICERQDATVLAVLDPISPGYTGLVGVRVKG